ncbi:hypothetical protein GCM10023201_41060 [Actinomycetospora corticicola]|uniref:Terminase small subunit n=1 Tax=Actinomycetospora corticicola TaxID=663602 RepID=A0A7Y9DWQ8_9PSEU|nr:hypothetical protein [Actinomycetospora corticicola]NYD36809.1 hypothetical protein [Actinomycetospora corticicola]
MPAHKKDETTRRRANVAATRTQLGHAEAAGRPRLPQFAPGKTRWHPQALRWWAELWDSPMASQYLRMDVRGLLRLAVLEHDYWSAVDSRTRLAVEAQIERAQRDYGLTPYDRRRLEWSVTTASPVRPISTAPSRAAAEAAPEPPPRADPRTALHALS